MEHLGIFSLLPVVAAIFLAIVTRKVILSLGIAILIAGFLATGLHPIDGIVFTAKDLLFKEATSVDHLKLIAFTLLVGAMIGILIKAGGANAFINSLSGWIKGRRSAQFLSWVSGILVFFDDYTNCIVVGNTMRPVFDRHKVSREKLAYIVDSTAAPISTLAVISTWVAFQVSLLDKAIESSGMQGDGYSFFLSSIGYNYYAWFAILFVFLVLITGRDFGPMLKAERAALSQTHANETVSTEWQKRMVFLFIFPILILILICFADLWFTGRQGLSQDAAFFEIIGNADAYYSMVKASLASLIVAIILALFIGRFSMGSIFGAIYFGAKEMMPAIGVLICAWGLAEGVEVLGAATYFSQALQNNVAPEYLPTVVFALASFVAFSTGTSFGTMGIMVPLTMPFAFAVTTDPTLHLAAAASILGGSVFGDHCSPISDTTVLSSAGSGSNLLEHVRTQLPYAILVALAAMLFGTLPVGFGVPTWACFGIGSIALLLTIRFMGDTAEKKSIKNELEKEREVEIKEITVV